MTGIDTRLLVFALWGIGTVIVYGDVLRGRYRAFRAHRDARGRRELYAAFALFLVAAASALSIFTVLFGPAGTGIRGLVVAISLGAFTAAGLVLRGERGEPEGMPTHPEDER
jgi:hypothetical protein